MHISKITLLLLFIWAVDAGAEAPALDPKATLVLPDRVVTVGEAVLAAEPVVQQYWFGDGGRYVLAERLVKDTSEATIRKLAASGIPDVPRQLELTLWDSRTNKRKVVFEADGAQMKIQQAGFLHDSPVALILVSVGLQKSLYRLDAKSGSVKPVASYVDEQGTEYHPNSLQFVPKAPYALVGCMTDVGLNGVLCFVDSNSISLQSTGHKNPNQAGFDETGQKAIIGDRGELQPDGYMALVAYRIFDFAKRTLSEPIDGVHRMPEFDSTEWSSNLTFAYTIRNDEKNGEHVALLCHSKDLLKATEPIVKGLSLYAKLSPDGLRFVYGKEGALFARNLIELTPSEWKAYQVAKERDELSVKANRLGKGLKMMEDDYPNGLQHELISEYLASYMPYKLDPSEYELLFDGDLSEMPKDGPVARFKGEYGSAVAYGDGHVRYIPD